MLALVQERAPWAVSGHSDELEKLYKNSPQEFAAEVLVRKKALGRYLARISAFGRTKSSEMRELWRRRGIPESLGNKAKLPMLFRLSIFSRF